MTKRTRRLFIIVATTLFNQSLIAYALPTRHSHSSLEGAFRHRAIASSLTSGINTTINAAKRSDVEPPTPCATEATRSDDVPIPTAFDFLQVPWIAGGAIEALTSLVLPLVQQGLDAISTSSPASVTSTTDASQSTGHVVHSAAVEETVVGAYYADWAAGQLAPEAIDWSRLNWIDFAFAVPDENFELTFTQGNSKDLLHRVVAAGHSQGRRVKLSIGGWTGSAHFSRAAYHEFDLDGIDIDWEYPNQTGAGNEHSPDDTGNFLKFLKQLRKKLPPSARITAATQMWPFAGKDGQPLGDVSQFARVLDWVLLMNYDVWGSSPNPGPNAPLTDGCGNSTQPLANAEATIRSWVKAGFTARQLVLGVPAYGYVSRSDRHELASRDESAVGGDTMDISAVEIKGDDGSSEAGQIEFNQLVAQGALVRNNGGGYSGAGGFQRLWDVCSSMPWLRSEAQRQVITYDDPDSMQLKGELAMRYGILGVGMWVAHGDSHWELVDGLRRGLGV